MASLPAVIVLSSDDEEDEVVFLEEVCASTPRRRCSPVKTETLSSSDKENDSKDNSVVIMDSPPKAPTFKVSKVKLESLKRSLDQTINGRKMAPASTVLQQNKFKINKARLKQLRAVVRIELDSMQLLEKSPVKIKEEKMDSSDDSEFGRCLIPSPKRNLQSTMIGNSPIKRNFQTTTIEKSPITRNIQPTTVKNSPIKRKLQPTAIERSPSKRNFQTTTIEKSPITRNIQPTTVENSPITYNVQPTAIESYFTSSPKKSPKDSLLHQKHLKSPTKPQSLFINGNKDLLVTPVTAKRNEMIWPPSHVILDEGNFVRRIFGHPKLFCTYFNDTVEGLLEEKFFLVAVKTMQGLLISDMAPPAALVRSLVKDVLLESRSQRLSVVTYRVLNDIHTRFPSSCLAMNIEWRELEDLYKSILSLITNGTKLQFLNATLALSFTLTVLSSEMKSVALKSKPTRITKLFSADFDMHNTREVIAGLRESLVNEKAICSAEKVGTTCSSGQSKGTFPLANSMCSLDFFQTLLKFNMVSSGNKEYVSIRIANELMYLYMDFTTLQARVFLLRTLKSHLIRRYLIEVLLMNYCSLRPEALQGNEVPLSARKILLQDFHRFPPRRSSSTDDGCWTTEEVEEYVTLVAYLLQSYVATHSMLQSYHGDFASFKSDQFKQITEDDAMHFSNLVSCTSDLRERCHGFLAKPEELSVRTYLLLDMMEVVV